MPSSSRGRALDSLSQGCEFQPSVGPCIVSLRQGTLLQPAPLGPGVQMGTCLGWEVTGLLCRGLATLSQQHYKLSTSGPTTSEKDMSTSGCTEVSPPNCDPLQQKVPYSPCYKLLVWYSVSHNHAAVFSSQEVHDIIGRKL